MAERNAISIGRRVKDETGNRYGELTVIEPVPDGSRRMKWRCRCDCGNVVVVLGIQLRSGNNKSCGCRKFGRGHGEAYGKDRTAEYQCWQDMFQRCYNPRSTGFHNYGGRGITVCDRWRSYEHFLADMGRRPSGKHSIDRRDNDGNYEPGNCRWAVKVEQDNNRRTNRLITFKGKRQSLTQWARELGIHPNTLQNRLASGWTPERAFSKGTPR